MFVHILSTLKSAHRRNAPRRRTGPLLICVKSISIIFHSGGGGDADGCAGGGARPRRGTDPI